MIHKIREPMTVNASKPKSASAANFFEVPPNGFFLGCREKCDIRDMKGPVDNQCWHSFLPGKGNERHRCIREGFDRDGHSPVSPETESDLFIPSAEPQQWQIPDVNYRIQTRV